MRLGLIGDKDATRLSGVYTPQDNVSAKTASNKVSRYAYENVFNALSDATSSQGFCFSADGTRLYATSPGTRTTAKIVQYNLSIPFDVSSVSYQSGKDLIIGDYESTVNGVDISSDGTRMFFTGSASDTVWSCTLSTPYDLATAAVDVKKFYVGGQDATPNTPFFGDSGTKMYVMGVTNDRVYQYNLTTAWDVTTASYTGNSLLVTAQDATPQGLFFGDSGTKLYVVGNTNDTVYQYTLSTAWDISTASYASLSFSVTGQDTLPRALFFKPDGLKMFVMGSTGDDVNEYDLSTAWNVSTASFVRVSAGVGEANPAGLWFKDDGTKMYVIGSTNDTVREFTLSTAWNVSTISFSKSLSIGFETLPTGITFKDDGTELYVLGQTNDTVYETQLGTAWDVGTAKGYLFVGGFETAPRSVRINSDGSVLYLVGSGSNLIRSYILSTAYELGIASAGSTLSGLGGAGYGSWISPDGTYGLVGLISATGIKNLSTVRGIRRFNMTTPGTLSTGSFVAVEFIDLSLATPYSVAASPDGTRLFALVDITQGIHQFSLRFA
jgi:sugar lactone lactonase YvrE